MVPLVDRHSLREMTQHGYTVTGPGVVRALQEAVRAGKDLVVVYDYDNFGHILRVGYFFKSRGVSNAPQTEVTWFDPAEIQVTRTIDQVNGPKESRLDAEFIHPHKNERHFLIEFALDAETPIILRNLYRLHRDHVAGFVIQVEIRLNVNGKEKWRPIVRYDHAHGFIHRDMIYLDGHKTKHKLGTQTTKDAVELAANEIRDNLGSWLHQLGYKTAAPHSVTQASFVLDMEKAKSTLLELHDDPKKIDATQSTFTWLKEKPDYIQRIWPPP